MSEKRERRFDLNGFELYEVINITECADCGMGLVSHREFHPYAACEEFKRTHDSNAVWRILQRPAEELRQRGGFGG